MINIPAPSNSWPTWVDGQAHQEAAVMPAASARMSSWPSALSLCLGLSERRPAHAGIERQWHPVYQRADVPCSGWPTEER
jgi:hypothetical protein